MRGSRISNALTEITDPSKTYYPQAFPRNGYGLCSKLVMGCTNQIPSLTFYEYRGYVIAGWARPELTKGSTSIGVVYKRDKFGSLLQVHRIEGKLFESKEQAEQHGIELCKEWIDKHL